MNQRRVEVFYQGRVQGVGFRQTTADLAENAAVVGWVKNLADGRVQLVAEGSERELKDFLKSIEQRLGAYVRQSVVEWSNSDGEFTDFHIAH